MKKLIQRAQSKVCFAECKNFGQNCLRRELRPNGKKMQWMVIAAIFSFCGCLTAAAQETEQFSIATLNVDGLPQKLLVWNLNAEGPGSAGSARIGKYLVRKGYDLVMMQASLKLTSCVPISILKQVRKRAPQRLLSTSESRLRSTCCAAMSSNWLHGSCLVVTMFSTKLGEIDDDQRHLPCRRMLLGNRALLQTDSWSGGDGSGIC
ncbi:MAG: hypothetical protein IJT28_05340 [Bacteroidaceae bacterium]|nr:hypothetical protein [Bacteroidaceae bacterium]